MVERVIGVAGDVLLLLLMVGGGVAVVWVVWMAIRVGRRRQLVVADLVNLTGHSAVDVDAAWMTQQMRASLLREFRSVSDRARFLLRRARIEPGQGELAPPQRDIEVSLRDLAASVTAIASERTRPVAQLLSDVMLRPSGTRIRGSLLRYGEHSRLGIGFDIVDLRGEQRPATFSLQSRYNSVTTKAVSETAAKTLIEAATRVLAVELLRLDLLRRQRRRSWRGDRNPGVVSRFIGLIYQASAPTYPEYQVELYTYAVNALREAVVLLPDDYHPLKDLGDTKDFLRAVDDEHAERHLAGALNFYDRAEEIAVRQNAGVSARLCVQVGRALAGFHSGGDSERAAARAEARALLDQLDAGKWDPAKERDEYLLYNAACLLSLELAASDGQPAQRALADRAIQLLGSALLRDMSPDRNVFGLVEGDPDLAGLAMFVNLGTLVRHFKKCQLTIAQDRKALKPSDAIDRFRRSPAIRTHLETSAPGAT